MPNSTTCWRNSPNGLAFRLGTPPDAIYTFKHALVQDAAYDLSLKSRRLGLDGKIARAIEARFPNVKRSALIEQLRRALDLIATLPGTPALRQEEIKLQVALKTPLLHCQWVYHARHQGCRREGPSAD